MESNQEKKITIKIPRPPITSLLFEGGGVEGLAYASAYRALKEKNGLLDQVIWVAGSSVGAMTALMIALSYTPDELEKELTAINFSKFAKSLPTGKLALLHFILKNTRKISTHINYGINDGKKLYQWIKKIVEKKLGNRLATFNDLKEMQDKNKSSEYKNLFVLVTNVDKRKTEIFSWETTPNLQIADAVLTSMSIPGYFYTRYIDKDEMRKIDWTPTEEKVNACKIIPYLDGGILNNDPINLFCEYKYWIEAYYGLAESHDFNPSSLSFRVDSEEKVEGLIEMREGETTRYSPQYWLINSADVTAMANKFLTLLMSDLTKVEQYSRVTVEIKDCGIKTTKFDLTEEDNNKLKASGKEAVNGFYREFLKENVFKTMNYNNLTELEDDYRKTGELLKTLDTLNYKDNYFSKYARSAMKFQNELIREKISELHESYNKMSKSQLFFVSSLDSPNSSVRNTTNSDNQPSDFTEAGKEAIKEVQNLPFT